MLWPQEINDVVIMTGGKGNEGVHRTGYRWCQILMWTSANYINRASLSTRHSYNSLSKCHLFKSLEILGLDKVKVRNKQHCLHSYMYVCSIGLIGL